MLKDLESRRTPQLPAGSVVLGSGVPAVQQKSNWLLPLLTLVVVALLAGIGYTLWQQWLPPSPPPVAAISAKPRPAAVPVEQRAAPASVKTEVVQQQVAEEPVVAEPPVKQLVEKREPEQNQKPAAVATADNATAKRNSSPSSKRSSSEGRMKKVIRPPTRAEQASNLYQQGYRAMQQRSASRAEELWLKALKIEPLHSRAREGLVALYLSQGRKPEAAMLLEEGVERQPDNMQFVMLLARLRAEQGDSGEALALLEEAMARDSRTADLFALSAALYQQQRDYEKSIAAYRRAVQLQPEQAHWWMGLGISQEGAEMKEEAKSSYEKALQRGGLSAKTRAYVEQRLAVLLR